MEVLEIGFWISLVVLLYTYLGYGLLVRILVAFKRKSRLPVLKDEDLPEVTHIIAAYNEEMIITQKIKNSLDLDYPGSKIRTVIVTDGSTDQTVQIVRSSDGIDHWHADLRKGKLHAVNRVIQGVKSPIVVFSDANAMLSRESIRQMVRHFQNHRIGAVAGEKVVLSETKDDATGSGEGLYWKYESWLKKNDFRLHSVVGAAGELFAIRTHLYHSPPGNMLIEDFMTSIQVAQDGYRVAYEPKAKAFEHSSASISEEIKRKIRISAGGLQAVWRLPHLLNFMTYGVLTFQYISHRAMRWTLAPLALVVLLITNFLLLQDGKWVYQVLFGAQLLFYSTSLLGYIYERKQLRLKLLFVPFYFTFMHISVFLGLVKLITGNYQVTWEKANRK